MRVNEIFYSIEGEGKRQGHLAVFIRFSGCNLRCSYCDTTYAQGEKTGEEMTIDEILAEISKYPTYQVTITGGEPLRQDKWVLYKLLSRLHRAGYSINIETNGACDLTELDGKLNDTDIITMDYKLPYSGMTHAMIDGNIAVLKPNDVLKFVISSIDEADTIEAVLKRFRPVCNVFLSPVFGKIKPEELVALQKALQAKGHVTRLQLQIHKLIWDPNQRGV